MNLKRDIINQIQSEIYILEEDLIVIINDNVLLYSKKLKKVRKILEKISFLDLQQNKVNELFTLNDVDVENEVELNKNMEDEA